MTGLRDDLPAVHHLQVCRVQMRAAAELAAVGKLGRPVYAAHQGHSEVELSRTGRRATGRQGFLVGAERHALPRVAISAITDGAEIDPW